MKIILEQPKNWSDAYHFELQSDLSANIYPASFTRGGKVSAEPESWEINLKQIDGNNPAQDDGYVSTYIYSTYSAYEHDCDVLGI